MADLINLTIDGVPVAVPKGTLIVDAAKRIGNDIPVFCYHPKLKPVGMCRMCLVEIGTPKVDPATKQVVKDDKGNVVIAWQPKLNTGCTTPVSEGMAVRTQTPVVTDAREDVLEFLLTSHPLDCPICDKGGECPLQNLTLAHGPGVSRFDYADKQHNDKHVPLGELIFLDRERCIQCSRCVRFQDEIADDHVLQFHDRGRGMEIVTFSDPGFDSYFSGNTTDICPVGALTTADFRFKARPWELKSTQSVCGHCAVGCNTSLNTRLNTSTGTAEIKRVMPRQNEQVNEIWLCDKGRFVHHYTRAAERVTRPLIRKDGKLQEATWESALQLISDKLNTVPGLRVAGVIGDRVANEDAWLIKRFLTEVVKTPYVAASPALPAAYADIARANGLGIDADFKQLGKGDVIIVVNGDLEEQAPVWFLRLRQAVVDRGAKLIVAHHRSTKMHRYAQVIARYQPGLAAQWVASNPAELQGLKDARNVVIVFGDDTLGAPNARALAGGLAAVLHEAGQFGKSNSGLLPLYPHGNTQGVCDVIGAGERAPTADVTWLVGVGDTADAPKAGFTIVSELLMTDLAKSADVVLPALSAAERDGTLTSGDRRVQRFYQALPALGEAKPDWWAAQEIAKRMGAGWSYADASAVFADMAAHVGPYAGMTYAGLAKVEAQWPPVGRDDLYYGGTVYDNSGGVGARTSRGDAPSDGAVPAEPTMEALTRPQPALYRPGELIRLSGVMGKRLV